jgi:hypothetical protein
MQLDTVLSPRVWTILQLLPAVPLVIAGVHDLLPVKLQFKLPHLIKLHELGLPLRKNELPRFKHLLLGFGNAFCLLLATFQVVQRGPSPLRTFSVIAWTYAFLESIFKRRVTPPYRLLAFYLLQLCVDVVGAFLYGRLMERLLEGAAEVVLIFTVLSLPIALYYPESTARADDQVQKEASTVNNQYTSPEDNLTLLNYLCVFYMNALLYRDSPDLKDHETWAISPLFKHKELYDAISAIQSSSLLRKYLKANALDLAIDVGLNVFSSTIAFGRSVQKRMRR